MRRLALLLAGGALWLVLMAMPAFADGGPHVVPTNNGTGVTGLTGDCASCHRAHTAQASSLLKSTQPGLCLSCHDGTGATTNVVDGIQYVPVGILGAHTSSVLGALRGGGFEYALIDPAGTTRLSYNSRGSITLTLGAAGSGTLDLVWPAFGSVPSRTLTITAPLTSGSAAALQATVNGAGFWGTSTTYTGSTSAQYMSGFTTNNMTIAVSTTAFTVTFTPHNEFRLVPLPLPSIANNTTGTTATVVNGISIGNVGHVAVLPADSKQSTTSMHEGLGTVWGNGPQGQGNVGATGVSLECTNCHNPHGNGQYRILNTLPGTDWKNDSVEATTTLTTALTAATDPIHVASAADFPAVNFYILVDSEKMLVSGGQGTTDWSVKRGEKGTTAAAHSSGATVKLIIADWTAPTNAVQVVDVGVTTSTKNYTVNPGIQASNVVGNATAGDYWRYKYDPSGLANFTNFYLLKDPMSSGWNGQSPTNFAAITSISNTTLAAALTATATSATVASTSGMPTHTPATEPQPTWLVIIDNEIMSVSVATTGTPASGFSATSIKISRGLYGTTADAHLSGATVKVIGTGTNQDATKVQLYNNTGLMTAWCISCHTRYNGWAQNGTSSLTAQTPSDTIFGFKHGTTSTGCEQCHVSHGTNVTMDTASTINLPDGSTEDSALLKVVNRGTCMLCHDPTGTVAAGTTVGTVPPGPTPGP